MTRPIAAFHSDGRPRRREAIAPAWARHGFSRPGLGAEVSRDLYQAALQDALAFTTDRDGCRECDRARLCETHAERATRAQQYQEALEHEMEVGEDTDNQRHASNPSWRGRQADINSGDLRRTTEAAPAVSGCTGART
jgi:hypothetical protein